MFQPQDPNFGERVRASFARQQLMATMTVTLMAVTGRQDIAALTDRKLPWLKRDEIWLNRHRTLAL